MILLNYITFTLESINGFILTILLTSSLTLFYLDGFKFSDIRLIKYIQIFSFVYIPFHLLICMYNALDKSLLDLINCMAENKDVNLHGHVKVDKEAGKAIGQGLQTIGSQIGLGATIAGVATAVSKAITKSGMPPVQKAGIILGSGIISGIAHSRISIMNRNMNNDTNFNSSSSTDASSNVSNFINDSISSPLQELLVNFEMMTYVCLSLIYIIVIQLLFKLYFKDEINFKIFSDLNAN